MATFEEAKLTLIEASKEANACKEGFLQLKNATTWFDLCVVARNSFEWCVENKVLTPELIREHLVDCDKAGIFCNQNVTNGFCIVTSSTEIDAYGHSFVIALENSIVNAYDTSYVIALGNSTIYCFDDVTVKAKDNVLINCTDYSRVHVYDDSKVNATGESIVYVHSSTADIKTIESCTVVSHD